MIDLMAKRYKCIARYPHSQFIIGENYTNEDCCKILNPNNVAGCLSVFSCEKYPAIFKELEWWEEREIEDFPEYVKINRDGLSHDYGSIQKVIHWGRFPDEGYNHGNENDLYALLLIEETTRTHDKGEFVSMNIKNLLPATKEQYEQYLNNKA